MKPFYQDDWVAIYHGDCRDVADVLEPVSVDLLLTDPPYGQGFKGQGKLTAAANIRADGVGKGVRMLRQAVFAITPALHPDAHVLSMCHWDGLPDFSDALNAYVRMRNYLVWHKDRGGMGDTKRDYARDYELVLYGTQGDRRLVGRRDGCVIRGIPPVGDKRRHPTEKPVALGEYLIRRHAPVGGLVVDPFAGVGPFLVAAKRLGRRAVGVELERGYCEVAAQDVRMTTAGIALAA